MAFPSWGRSSYRTLTRYDRNPGQQSSRSPTDRLESTDRSTRPRDPASVGGTILGLQTFSRTSHYLLATFSRPSRTCPCHFEDPRLLATQGSLGRRPRGRLVGTSGFGCPSVEVQIACFSNHRAKRLKLEPRPPPQRWASASPPLRSSGRSKEYGRRTPKRKPLCR